jgi:hypothetical protein
VDVHCSGTDGYSNKDGICRRSARGDAKGWMRDNRIERNRNEKGDRNEILYQSQLYSYAL